MSLLWTEQETTWVKRKLANIQITVKNYVLVTAWVLKISIVKMKKYSPENPDRWQRVQVAFGLIAIGWKQSTKYFFGSNSTLLPSIYKMYTNYCMLQTINYTNRMLKK